MKKSNIILLSAFLLLLAGIAITAVYLRGVLLEELEELEQGDGNIVKEQRHVSPFGKLNVSENLTVYFAQDTVSEFFVEADSNLLKHIKTDVADGVMNISYSRGIRARNVKVHISQEFLDEVSLSGGSRFMADKPMMVGDIFLIANGGSRFEIEGEFELLNMELNAGSYAILSGRCGDLYVSATAGSNLKAEEMETQNVVLNATAGSNLEVHAVKTLSVNATSGSNISYYGKPELKQVQTRSGASLRQK